jgi:phosphoribosylformylglycinamidine cyclo-ligase
VEEDEVLGADRVRDGDALVGLASSGLHTNGYTLARRIVADRLRLGAHDRFPETDGTVADALLAVHRSYLAALAPVLDRVHAMAHITGGGLTDNVPRVLPENLDAHIKLGSWPVLPIFQLIFEKGQVDREEMLRVFNMGIGMVLLAAPDQVDRIAKHFAQIGQQYFFIGNVVKGSGKVAYDVPPAGFASWIE